MSMVKNIIDMLLMYYVWLNLPRFAGNRYFRRFIGGDWYLIVDFDDVETWMLMEERPTYLNGLLIQEEHHDL